MTITMPTAPVLDPLAPFLSPVSPVAVGEVKYERLLLAPALASAWLEVDVVKRKVYPAHVTKIATDIKGHRFVFNGETIKRAANGGILDGQHRLRACVEADMPIDTAVISGLPPEIQSTVDIGAVRKMADHLSLLGHRNTVILGAVAKWSLIWLWGYRGRPGAAREPTYAQQLEFVAIEPRLPEAADFAALAYKDFKTLRPAVWGMSHLLLTGANDIAATVFLNRLRDGADISIGHPVHTLRKRIWDEKEARKKMTDWYQLALVIIAWNSFRNEESVTRLHMPKGGLTPKTYPVPA